MGSCTFTKAALNRKFNFQCNVIFIIILQHCVQVSIRPKFYVNGHPVDLLDIVWTYYWRSIWVVCPPQWALWSALSSLISTSQKDLRYLDPIVFAPHSNVSNVLNFSSRDNLWKSMDKWVKKFSGKLLPNGLRFAKILLNSGKKLFIRNSSCPTRRLPAQS